MTRFAVLLALAAIGLAACDPHAADSAAPGQAGEPADAPASAPQTDFSGDFNLTGTEPFWSLAIRPDKMVLSRPDEMDFAAPNNGPQVEGDTAVWDGGPLKVTLRVEACSDGMSDRMYGFSAVAELTGMALLKGCANRQGGQ